MFLFKLLSYLPFPVLYGLSSLLASLLNAPFRYRRRVIENNLSYAFPDKSPEAIRKLRKDFYQNFTDVWLEALKGLTMPPEQYRKRVKLLNPSLLTGFIDRNQSVMVFSSHRSGWEWLTPSHSLILPVKIDAVYQVVENKFFDRLMYLIRSRFGARMVEKDDLLRDSIRRNHIPRLLAIMSDLRPHKPVNCLWIDFMNRPTPFYNASEKLARKLKMPVVYADMQRVSRGHYEVNFILLSEAPEKLPENELTKKYVKLIEDGIKRSPAEYLWSHKRWKHKQPAEMI